MNEKERVVRESGQLSILHGVGSLRTHNAGSYRLSKSTSGGSVERSPPIQVSHSARGCPEPPAVASWAKWRERVAGWIAALDIRESFHPAIHNN
jgi:hypothetical protein